MQGIRGSCQSLLCYLECVMRTWPVIVKKLGIGKLTALFLKISALTIVHMSTVRSEVKGLDMGGKELATNFFFFFFSICFS